MWALLRPSKAAPGPQLGKAPKMAANGISTLPNKADRKAAKIALATAKRQNVDSNGYRALNVYTGSVAPVQGRPWAVGEIITYSLVDENGNQLVDENDNILIA